MTYHNNILLDVFSGDEISRPPVWIMRQAGRILPGYKRIRSAVSGFKELVKSPDLIAEATVEPLEVLGVDAAILFSDILVIPEAMGVDYDIIEKTGPVFDNPIRSVGQIDHLRKGEEVLPKLDYVFQSIEVTREVIAHRNPLIGFAGAPWTLFAYMIEGSGSKTFSRARKFLYEEPDAAHRLMDAITESLIAYLKEKINRGCDVIQLFDSWAEMLTEAQYKQFCIPYISRIFEELPEVPKIFFPKGAWSSISHFKGMAFDALSIDWKTPVTYVREQLGANQIIQGNIDPALLYARPMEIESAVHEHIRLTGRNLIVNLGHGVYPNTNREHVKVLVDAVKEYRY